MFEHVYTCEPDMLKHAELRPLLKLFKRLYCLNKRLHSKRVWPIPARPPPPWNLSI